MSKRRSCHTAANQRPKSSFWLRLFVFGGLVVIVLGAAVRILRPDGTDLTADQTVEITMAGFQPATLSVPAGRSTTVLLKNPDSPFHTDGGGVHQFAVPELGLDVRVQPRSAAVATIPAASPGSYTFHCDTCCGGKKNPSMRGTLVVG